MALKELLSGLMSGKSKDSMDWLIVGLGNPGKEYANTRHNAGAMVLEKILERHGDDFDKFSNSNKFKARVAKGRLSGQKVFLVFPQTYMNLSGNSVADAANFYKINPNRILVIFDDKEISLGSLRLRLSGSAGGHNGVKSIIEKLGTQDFPRLRVGIGTEISKKSDAANFVLGKPSKEELAELEKSVTKAAEEVEVILTEGPDTAMNRYN